MVAEVTFQLQCQQCHEPMTVAYRTSNGVSDGGAVSWDCPDPNCRAPHARVLGGSVIRVWRGWQRIDPDTD